MTPLSGKHSFRGHVLLILLLSLGGNFLITGSIIITGRALTIEKAMLETAETNSRTYILFTERILNTLEKQLHLVGVASRSMADTELQKLLATTLYDNHLANAIYIISDSGHVLYLEQIMTDEHSRLNLIGNDFSSLPLFQKARLDSIIAWSGKFISPLTGEETIGAALSQGDIVVMAEISIERLLKDLEAIPTGLYTREWFFDQNSNLLADIDTEMQDISFNTEYMRLSADALSWNNKVPGIYTWKNRKVYLGTGISEKIGWRVISRVPALFDNPLVISTIQDVLIITAASFIIAAVLLVLLMRRVNSSVQHLIDLSRETVMDRKTVETWPDLGIREFNELSTALKTMTEKVHTRENSLKALNEELEDRVSRRTNELKNRNQELSDMLITLRQTQDDLIKSEKMASLGRLVAGVAHELNTPLGNSIMALSTVKFKTERFIPKVEAGFPKADLMEYFGESTLGLDIAQRNLEKAADLLSSFKQVANDQAGNIRRKFILDKVLLELLQTMHPTIKRMPHKLETDFEPGIQMESYPGIIDQIVANLITNAIMHAWSEGDSGILKISCQKDGVTSVAIRVEDNGNGIDEDIQTKIFDPFFTTNREKGGTGLGLRIAKNGAENILGGDLSLHSKDSGGTVFTLLIPLQAPVIDYQRDY